MTMIKTQITSHLRSLWNPGGSRQGDGAHIRLPGLPRGMSETSLSVDGANSPLTETPKCSGVMEPTIGADRSNPGEAIALSSHTHSTTRRYLMSGHRGRRGHPKGKAYGFRG